MSPSPSSSNRNDRLYRYKPNFLNFHDPHRLNYRRTATPNNTTPNVTLLSSPRSARHHSMTSSQPHFQGQMTSADPGMAVVLHSPQVTGGAVNPPVPRGEQRPLMEERKPAIPDVPPPVPYGRPDDTEVPSEAAETLLAMGKPCSFGSQSSPLSRACQGDGQGLQVISGTHRVESEAYFRNGSDENWQRGGDRHTGQGIFHANQMGMTRNTTNENNTIDQPRTGYQSNVDRHRTGYQPFHNSASNEHHQINSDTEGRGQGAQCSRASMLFRGDVGFDAGGARTSFVPSDTMTENGPSSLDRVSNRDGLKLFTGAHANEQHYPYATMKITPREEYRNATVNNHGVPSRGSNALHEVKYVMGSPWSNHTHPADKQATGSPWHNSPQQLVNPAARQSYANGAPEAVAHLQNYPGYPHHPVYPYQGGASEADAPRLPRPIYSQDHGTNAPGAYYNGRPAALPSTRIPHQEQAVFPSPRPDQYPEQAPGAREWEAPPFASHPAFTYEHGPGNPTSHSQCTYAAPLAFRVNGQEQQRPDSGQLVNHTLLPRYSSVQDSQTAAGSQHTPRYESTPLENTRSCRNTQAAGELLVNSRRESNHVARLAKPAAGGVGGPSQHEHPVASGHEESQGGPAFHPNAELGLPFRSNLPSEPANNEEEPEIEEGAALENRLRDNGYNETKVEGRFKCQRAGCEKSYTQKNDLKRHVMQAHLKRKAHRCIICGLRVDRASSMYRHLKRHLIHNEEHRGQGKVLTSESRGEELERAAKRMKLSRKRQAGQREKKKQRGKGDVDKIRDAQSHTDTLSR